MSMTALQRAAWQRPFLDGSKVNLPALFDFPRKDWAVALSLNL